MSTSRTVSAHVPYWLDTRLCADHHFWTCAGQEAFIRHVDSIPTSLLRPGATALRPELFGERGRQPSTGTVCHDLDNEDEVLARTALTPYSARLSFLARYRDFFAFYARGERRQAASLLVLLLSSNVAPRNFYGVMLLDVVPLLESESNVAALLAPPCPPSLTTPGA